MKSLITFLITMLAIALPASAEETYRIDASHTFPGFEVKHAGLTTTRGFFQRTRGTITLDRDAQSGSAEIIIDTTSVDTGNSIRDEMLREWFKVDQFPTMSYRSKSFKFSGNNLTGIDGELTLLGITRPVSLDITAFGCRPNPINKRNQCGADAIAQIKRSEFGMRSAMNAASDDIKILLQIEATQQ